MVERVLIPMDEFEIKEEPDESDIRDVKGYCYNIASKKEVPRDWPLENEYEEQVIRFEEYELFEEKNPGTIAAKKTRGSRKDKIEQQGSSNRNINTKKNTSTSSINYDEYSRLLISIPLSNKFVPNYESAHNVDDKFMNSKQTIVTTKLSPQNSSELDKIGKRKYPILRVQPSKSRNVNKNVADFIDFIEETKKNPSVSSIQPIIKHKSLPNVRKPKRKKKLQKSSSEPRSQKFKRLSYKQSLSMSPETTQSSAQRITQPGEEFHLRKDKVAPQDSQPGSISQQESSRTGSTNKTKSLFGFVDLNTNTPENIRREDEKSTDPLSLINLSPRMVEILNKASVSAKEIMETRKLNLHPSLRRYTDICDCLPGTCTCGFHFLFQTMKEPLSTPETEATSDSSCLCYHSLHKLNEVEEEGNFIITDGDFELIPRPATPAERLILCPKKRKYEKTVVIVKPEAMKFKDVILRAIKKEGLDIIDERLLHLTPEQVTEIYKENYGSAYFLMFVQQMSSTPVWILSVAGISAIERWKNIIGDDEAIHSTWFYPESIKRRFGLYSDMYGAMKTSFDSQDAKRDLQYFFPLDILEPIIIDSTEVQDYCDEYIHPTLLKALYNIVQQKPEDPLMYLGEWILKHNPNTPSFPDSLVALAPI